MSRGPGNVRRVPLAIFADNPKPLSSYDLAERVYGVRPDCAGDVWLSDAQLSSTRRALGGLAKQGVVSGRRAFMMVDSAGRRRRYGRSTTGPSPNFLSDWLARLMIAAILRFASISGGIDERASLCISEPVGTNTK